MTDRKYVYTFICMYLFSSLHEISGDKECDKSKCKGPVKYYEELKCIPIYGTEDSCCAIKYNCDHLKGRSTDKCYYKGHVYKIGDKLRQEDAKPCNIGCVCIKGSNSAAFFVCPVVDCFNRPEPGCYLKRAHDQCCSGPQVCPQNSSETIARCEVDGETYLDGQVFTPKSDPKQYCICSEGYEGKNVAPFCKLKEDIYSCNVELHNSNGNYSYCIPAFYSRQNPATDCHYSSRCQNKDDRVVETDDATKIGVTPVSDPGSTCAFGQLTMKLGDQINSGTHYDSVCVKCVCEVPPLPTCQRLPDDECDVTVHAKFDNYSKYPTRRVHMEDL